MEKRKPNKDDEWMLLESKCNALLSDQMFAKQQQQQSQQNKQSPRIRNGPRRLLLGRNNDTKFNSKKPSPRQQQSQQKKSGGNESLSEVLSIVNDLRMLAAAKKSGSGTGAEDENQTVLSEPLPLPRLRQQQQQQQQRGGGTSGRYNRTTVTGGIVSRAKCLGPRNIVDESSSTVSEPPQRQYRGRSSRNINNIEPPSRTLQRGSTTTADTTTSSRRNIRSESPMLRRASSERNFNSSVTRTPRPQFQRGTSDRNLQRGGSLMSRDKCFLPPPRRSMSEGSTSRNRFKNNMKPVRSTSDQAVPPLPSSTVTSTSSSEVEVVLTPRQKFRMIGSDQSVSTLSTASMSSFESSNEPPCSVKSLTSSSSSSSPFYMRSMSNASSGSGSSSSSRRVSFSRHPITEVRTRPFTPEEDIPCLYYSQEDTERFRKENDRRRRALSSDSSVIPNVPIPPKGEGYDEEVALPGSSSNANDSSGSKFDTTLSPPPTTTRRKRVKDKKSWHALLRKGRCQSISS